MTFDYLLSQAARDELNSYIRKDFTHYKVKCWSKLIYLTLYQCQLQFIVGISLSRSPFSITLTDGVWLSQNKVFLSPKKKKVLTVHSPSQSSQVPASSSLPHLFTNPTAHSSSLGSGQFSTSFLLRKSGEVKERFSEIHKVALQVIACRKY